MLKRKYLSRFWTLNGDFRYSRYTLAHRRALSSSNLVCKLLPWLLSEYGMLTWFDVLNYPHARSTPKRLESFIVSPDARYEKY